VGEAESRGHPCPRGGIAPGVPDSLFSRYTLSGRRALPTRFLRYFKDYLLVRDMT
jgi:hypothetical protein